MEYRVSTLVRLHSTSEVYRYAAAPVRCQPSSAIVVVASVVLFIFYITSDTSNKHLDTQCESAFNYKCEAYCEQ